MAVPPDEAREFETHRPRLFALAYRLLGSAAEADDAVQDTFLRWTGVDRAAIDTPAAWLTTVLTNLCRNWLTSARARRVDYVGPWLPEPVLTEDGTLGPLDTATRRESVSLAVLVLLERLTPAERAVYVLRTAFGYPHREIAAILGLTEGNSQQLYRRAKLHVDRERPRFAPSDRARHALVERFLSAARGGNLAALERMLAAEVTAWADGGGKIIASRKPVVGAGRVAGYLCHWMSRPFPDLRARVVEVNGQPAVVFSSAECLLAVVAPEFADGRANAVHIVVNPDKLTFLAGQLSLTPGLAALLR